MVSPATLGLVRGARIVGKDEPGTVARRDLRETISCRGAMTDIPIGRQSRVPAAKITPPAIHAGHVVRERLLEQALAARDARLVLVRAAAGFGKTIFMSQLRQRWRDNGVAGIWLTLDASDNDAARFLASLRAAVSAGFGTAVPSAPLLDVLDWLAARSDPFALFLDDLESLREDAVLGLVRGLIDALPQGSRVVIGTRSLPDLPLPRLRARGQLLDIGTAELRFDPDATAELFSRRGSTLGRDAIAGLHAQVEGWVTALSLASQALTQVEDKAAFLGRFSASTRAVADYLSQEVLARQPEEVREFLLRTSVLRHLEVELCQALVPRVPARQVLQQLERDNLFVVALPGAVPAWRYDRAFGEFLRGQLLLTRPEETTRLHLLAAAWYEAQARPVPAIDHAIQGTDYPLALSLLARHAQALLEEGRMRLLARWFDAIPEDALAAHEVLKAIAVWAVLFTRGPAEAAARLERSGCRHSADAAVRAHVNAQWPLLLTMQDRYEEAVPVGDASLAQLPSGNAFADGVLRNAMAHAFTVVGESARAQQLIDDARRHAPDSLFNRMYAESIEGLLDLQGGRLKLAASRFRAAVSATRAESHNYGSGNAWAGILYAGALYEANDFDAAQRLVSVYLPMARDVGLPGHMNSGYMIRARIAFSRGEIDRSYDALTELEYLAHHRQLRRIVANAKLERARLLLLQGDAQASREELDRADDPALWERVRRQRLAANELDYHALARVRWTIHFGEARSVLGWLEDEIAQATAQQRLRRAMRLRVLASLAAQRSGDPGAAVKTMAGVVRHAAQEGFVRVIADEGPEVGRIVQVLHAMQQQMPVNRSDPGLLKHLETLLRAFGPLPVQPAAPEAGQGLMEPLTRKEIQVLQLAADGHSNAAMAEKLHASDSTVRTHLRAINSKLGARSRAEAVAIGRRFGVIR